MKKLFLFLCSTLISFWISFASISDSVINEESNTTENNTETNIDSLTELKDSTVENAQNNENNKLLSDIKDDLAETIENNENSNIISSIKEEVIEEIGNDENTNLLTDLKDELTEKIENNEDTNILTDLKDRLTEKVESIGDINPLTDIKDNLNNKYSEEFNDAYDFAFDNDITTMDSIDNANMDGWLTRIAMAKMLSNYAINILWKKPANIVVPNFKDVSEKLNDEYGNAVDLAYQLWIMWIWIDKFRPNDPVTRAEFATALSRMLYWLEDWIDKYYTTHLQKLKDEGIISNDNPNLKELRWYVMIMLMRSAKNKLWTLKEKIENKLTEDIELLYNN